MFDDFRLEEENKRNWFKISLQVILIGIFILAILYFLRKYSADISNLKNLSWTDVVVIGFWSAISYTAYAYAVYLVFIDLGLKKLGPLGWLRIYYVSRLVNFFITQGGNLYRLIVLKKKYGFSYTNTVGVTAFLIWINALIAVLAAAIVLLRPELDVMVEGLSLFAWSIVLLFGLLAVVPVMLYVVRSGLRRPETRAKFLTSIVQIAEFFVATLRNQRLFARIGLLSCVHFAFFVGVNYFSFRAIGQSVDVGIVCIFSTAFVFTRYINIVPGNLGLSELVGGLMSEQLGIGFSNGLMVTGIVRMIEVIMILVAGAADGRFIATSLFKRS